MSEFDIMNSTWRREKDMFYGEGTSILVGLDSRLYSFRSHSSHKCTFYYDTDKRVFDYAVPPPLSASLSDHNYTLIGTKLYCISPRMEQKSFVFDFDSDTWTEIPDPPEYRTGGATMALQGKVYITSLGTDLLVFDTATNLWSKSEAILASSSSDRHYGVSYGDKLYLFNPTTKALVIYHPESGTVSSGTPMPQTLYNKCQTVVCEGKIYFPFARTANNAPASTKLLIYDIATDTYSYGPELPYDSGSCRCAVVQNRLYVTRISTAQLSTGNEMYSLQIGEDTDPGDEPGDGPGDEPGDGPGGEIQAGDLFIFARQTESGELRFGARRISECDC